MFDWGYETEAEPNLNGRRIEAMRGKVLGGSSSINVMAYTRGNRGDYDRWAQKGARGWSYADVLPYFRRAETWEGGENTWRGGSGPLGTEFAKTPDPLFDAWIDAGKAVGLPQTTDYNGEAAGRLRPRPVHHPRRPPLVVGARLSAAGAQAGQPHGRDRRACDARADAGHARHRRRICHSTAATSMRAEADREVIVASGTFNSPQLLMLSGIGPAAHLARDGHQDAASTCRSARTCRIISAPT